VSGLVKNRFFFQKIEILVKNRNVGQKSKFLSKIEINRNNCIGKILMPIIGHMGVRKIRFLLLSLIGADLKS